jgi:hypothetical protein
MLILLFAHPIVDQRVKLAHDGLAILWGEVVKESEITGINTTGVKEVAAQALQLQATR